MTDNLKKELYHKMALGVKNGDLEYLNCSMPSYEELKNSPSEFFKYVWGKSITDEQKKRNLQKICEFYECNLPCTEINKNHLFNQSRNILIDRIYINRVKGLPKCSHDLIDQLNCSNFKQDHLTPNPLCEYNICDNYCSFTDLGVTYE